MTEQERIRKMIEERLRKGSDCPVECRPFENVESVP